MQILCIDRFAENLCNWQKVQQSRLLIFSIALGIGGIFYTFSDLFSVLSIITFFDLTNAPVLTLGFMDANSSRQKDTSHGLESDRVSYLRDRYNIDVQPDQLSSFDQDHPTKTAQTSPISTASTASTAAAAQPYQNYSRRPVLKKTPGQTKPKLGRPKARSKGSNATTAKKAGRLLTGAILTGTVLIMYKVHIFFALLSTVAMGAMGVAMAMFEWTPELLQEWAAMVLAAAAILLGVSFNVLHIFAFLFMFHIFYGIAVVALIALIAKFRRAKPFSGGGAAFKITLAILILIMHVIPVANFFVIIPMLIWVWIIALTK